MYKPGDIVVCIECPYCSESVYHEHEAYDSYPLQVTVGHPFEIVEIKSDSNGFVFDVHDTENPVSDGITVTVVKILDPHPDLKDMVCEVAGNPEDYFATISPIDAALFRKGKWVPEEMLERYQGRFGIMTHSFDPRKGLVTRYGKVRDSG